MAKKASCLSLTLWQMNKEGKSAVSVAQSAKMYSATNNRIMDITQLHGKHVSFIMCLSVEFVRHLRSRCFGMQGKVDK